MSQEQPKKVEKATFAAGCFWCIESVMAAVKGVISATSGYTGGSVKNPTYEEVSEGTTGHFEALEVLYDPAKISYEKLLDIFWQNIDPTQADGQFHDIGPQYRTAVFYHDDAQRKIAVNSKEKLEESGHYSRPIVTEILAAEIFYPAEEYHQGYSKKNPIRYKGYRFASGRDPYIQKIWGKDATHHPEKP